MDFQVKKFKNGDFEVIAERPTKEMAERCATWIACFAEPGTVIRVDQNGQPISEIRKTEQNGF